MRRIKLLERIAAASPGAINAGDTLIAALTNMHTTLESTQQENANLRAQVEELRTANQQLEAGAPAGTRGFRTAGFRPER